MKPLLLIVALATVVGCGGKNGKAVITGKDYIPPTGGYLPDCICRYTYKGLGNWDVSFQDSCHKYNVGDTLR